MKHILTPTREWISNFPRYINERGCWIPLNSVASNKGYIYVEINKSRFILSRLSMCIFNNVDYDNPNIDTRHNTGCSRACFNPEHLKPGTPSENTMDSVKDKTHPQARKECCPKCGCPYSKRKMKRNGVIGWVRYCSPCRNEYQRNQ